jgi:hypothetical protein
MIGVNLEGLSYWTHELVFVDAFKMSSSWVSLYQDGYMLNSYWDNGLPISLRDDGYPASLLPGQIVGKLLLRNLHLHAPAGSYVALFDGDGTIDVQFDAKVTAVYRNRVEFTFRPTTVPGCTAAYCSDNGILLRITATNPANPVRNIRVIMPGFEHTYLTQPFHPVFLKNMEHYSVLRFMNWQATNNNNETNWVDRVLQSDDTQASRGVALEYMILLANTLGANPYFSIPHKSF